MPWVPIHESGVPFEFWGEDFDACTMDGSVVTNDTTRSDTPYALSWSIYFPESGVRLRLTTTEYEKFGGVTPANTEKFEWGGQEQGNEASNPINSFEPSPFEAEVVAEGEIIFVPDTGTEGAPELTQKVLVEVWVGGGLVANDDEATTNAGTPVTVDVLANDTLDDEPVTLGDLAGPPTILSQPEFGEAVVEADGRITYTPPAGFAGEVEIPYMIETADAGCPELFFSNSVVPAEDVETAVGGFGANNIYFEFGGFTFSFHRTIDEEFWPDPGNYMPCNPSDVELPEFPWQVDLYWGDGGGGVCVSINNECF